MHSSGASVAERGVGTLAAPGHSRHPLAMMKNLGANAAMFTRPAWLGGSQWAPA